MEEVPLHVIHLDQDDQQLVLFDDYTAGLLKDDKVIDVSDCGVNPNGGASFFGLCRTTSQSREL